MANYNKFEDMALRLEEEIWELKKEIETLRERLQIAEQSLLGVKTNIFNLRRSKARKETISKSIETINNRIAEKTKLLAKKNSELNRRRIQSRALDTTISIGNSSKEVAKKVGHVARKTLTPKVLIIIAFSILVTVGLIKGLENYHTHVWIDATCTTPEHCKICGKERGEMIDHCWLEADCERAETCAMCGKTRGLALGHVWSDASCTSPSRCQRCGKTTGTPLGHITEGFEVVKEATCGEDGTSEGICERCNEFVSVVVPKTGEHVYSEWNIVKAPTCVDDGQKERTCVICNELDTESIPKTGEHTYSDWITVKEPTCTEEGSKERTCSVCEKKEIESIPQLGHDDDEKWVITKHATEYTLGEKVTHCLRCGDVCQRESFDYSEEEAIYGKRLYAKDISVYFHTDYAHFDHGTYTYLGNGEGVTITISASIEGVTGEEIIMDYDESLLKVEYKGAEDSEYGSRLSYYVTARKTCSTELDIYTRYEVYRLVDDGKEEEIECYACPIVKLDSSDGRVVYITDNGEKYHSRESCPGDGAYPTTIWDVLQYEYEPCSKCVH